MKLIEITEKKDWSDLLERGKNPSFLQSWEWGVLQTSLGKELRRFSLEGGEKKLGLISLIREERKPFSGYWIAPKGPVFFDELHADFTKLGKLLEETLKEKTMFVRVEPELASQQRFTLPKKWKRHRAYNPSTTYCVDLTQSEGELLEHMHQKTRYNIRVAKRHGVITRLGTEQDLPLFLKLMQETAGRDGFRQHEGDYLRSTYEALQKEGMACIRVAEQEGELLAANLEIAFAGTLTYLYGASSGKNRNVMAPYLLHWEAIKAAKKEGLVSYDFWGANPADETELDFKSSWKGISRFKERWGGERLEYVGTYDIPLQPLLYKVLKTFGRL